MAAVMEEIRDKNAVRKNKMAKVSPSLLVITLSVNRLNSLIKRHKLT